MTIKIDELMQRRVCTITMDHSMADIESLFSRAGLSWGPVVESSGTVVGVVSASDLVRLHAHFPQPELTPAWQLCTYKPICVPCGTPAAEVARQMVERGVHHVVVTQGTEVAGVVSSLDFTRAWLAEDAALSGYGVNACISP